MPAHFWLMALVGFLGSLMLWVLNDMRTSVRELGKTLRDLSQEIAGIDRRVVVLEDRREGRA